ncbi:uncharacterized protein AstCC [Macrobrachium rosenbergii]|uniref:uncharacterized protein AstCC n=1 Tax=Macrobrachium rosenbergii TaxID=79674 RepID=UPI0034D75F93
MNGRAGGGSTTSSAGGSTTVGAGARSRCCPLANSRCSIPFLLFLLLPVLTPLVMMPADAVPHSALQRPQYIEAIRPVLPNSAGFPPQQMVIQQLPENVPPPRKRAAIVLDKLMFALQKALDDTPNATSPGHQQGLSGNRAFAAGPMDLQRRGNNDGRLYWRCYFNAVSCF